MNDVPAIEGKAGAARYRFAQLYADRAYDSDLHPEGLVWVGAYPKIARRNTDHGSGLGAHRCVVTARSSRMRMRSIR